MPGLLTRLLAALLAQHDEPRGMDGHVFEPACVPTWQGQCDAVDSLLDSVDEPMAAQRMAGVV